MSGFGGFGGGGGFGQNNTNTTNTFGGFGANANTNTGTFHLGLPIVALPLLSSGPPRQAHHPSSYPFWV